jgi:hypothetical protein
VFCDDAEALRAGRIMREQEKPEKQYLASLPSSNAMAGKCSGLQLRFAA